MAEFGSTADSGRCLSLTAGPATSRAAETRWTWPARARRSLDREARPGRRHKRSSGAQRKVRLVGSDREPPDWALPAWDTIDVVGEPARPTPTAAAIPTAAASPTVPPPGRFGLRILAVSEVTRAVREAVRGDDRLRDVWVEGEVGRVTISSMLPKHPVQAIRGGTSVRAQRWQRLARMRPSRSPCRKTLAYRPAA